MASTRIPRKTLAVIEYDDEDLNIEDNASSAAIAYKYDPLPDAHHFRLLELKPGERSSRLKCSLSTHSFDAENVPVYRAVSYTWIESEYDRLVILGNPVSEFPGIREQYEIRHPIWCDDGRRLLISTNLRDALRLFRHPTLPITLWIDALCINQEDLEERSRQVLLMPRIYHSSISVWLWLGEATEDSDTALDWIAKISGICNTKNGLTGLGDLGEMVLSLLDVRYSANSEEWKAVVRFFQRPVFRRIWIVQEIVTGPKVIAYCGSSTLEFESIMTAVEAIAQRSWDHVISVYYNLSSNFLDCFRAFRGIREEWYLNRCNIRRRLVHATRRFQASDPKDKVYALMGLFNDFAHRRPCDLQICEHPTANQIQEKYPNIKVNYGDGGSTGKGLIARSLRELMKIKAESLICANEQKAIRTLHGSEKEHISAIFPSFIQYLLYSLNFTSALLSRHTEEEPLMFIIQKHHEGGVHTDTESETDSSGNCIATILASLVTLDQNDLELRRVDNYVRATLQFVQEGVRKIRDLRVSGDALPKLVEELHMFRDKVSKIIERLGSGIPDGEPSQDDIHSAEEFQYIASHHTLLLFSDYDPGNVVFSVINGIYAVACDSSEVIFFKSALKAVQSSQHGLPISDSRLHALRAYFGDMSEWSEEKPGLLVKGTFQLDFVEPDWNAPPFVSADERENIQPDRNSMPGVINYQPLQHWSWSSGVSRMPDYHLSEADVYREFTLRCLMDDPDLFILSAVENRSLRRITGMPSWVPDFSVIDCHTALAYPSYETFIPYSASGTCTPFVEWTGKNPSIIHVRAWEIDQIDALASNGSVKVDRGASEWDWEEWDEWEDLISKAPPAYGAGEEIDAFWRTLVGNCTHAPAYEYPAAQTYGQFFEARRFAFRIRRLFATAQMRSASCEDLLESEGISIEEWNGLISLAEMFAKAAKRVMQDRRFFTTKKGYFGAAPLSARPGDVICLFAGARTPHVVRLSKRAYAVSNGQTIGTYEYVGECYCHGFMEGQALEGNGLVWQEIRMC